MPKRITWLDAAREVASVQDALITSAQLAQLGASRSTISYRNRMGGMWNRVLPGVHALTSSPLTERQRLRAALLYSGEGAVITGICSLMAHGFPSSAAAANGTVHVLIPHDRIRQNAGFVVVERTRRPPDPVEIDGLPFAPPARSICDAARISRSRSDVYAVVTECVAKGVADKSDLRRELLRGQRRGSAYLREALDHADGGAWSGPEADLRDVVLSSNLPEPRWNALITTPDGKRVAIVDGLWDDVWLAIEVNSRAHHAESSDWHATLDRSSRLAAHGIVVLHVTPARVQRDREGVLAQISQARAALLGRKLPSLRWEAAPAPYLWLRAQPR